MILRDGSSPDAAIAFIEKHGVALESGRGPVPSLAEAIAGQPIRGSWWGHPHGRTIFRVTRAMRDSHDVLVCRWIDGKITYVHKRLWPALFRLADEIGPRRLGALREEHTASGAHRLVTTAFPRWVPREVVHAAGKLSVAEARRGFGSWLTSTAPRRPAKKR
jgi:hypothetical protein